MNPSFQPFIHHLAHVSWASTVPTVLQAKAQVEQHKRFRSVQRFQRKIRARAAQGAELTITVGGYQW